MKRRGYFTSSSFVMASLFLMLLALAAAFVIYALGVHSPIEDPLFFWLGGAALAAMVIIVVISFYISLFVVGRVNQIAETARQIIETGDLTRRIEVENRWDDLSDLAQLLNSFLSRMEQLIQNVRDVSDNIAHDLRTPLSRLRGQLQKMADASDHAGVDIALQETDRILSTFQALLRIANIEKGMHQQAFKPVALHTILYDVLELYAPIAEEKAIAVSSRISAVEMKGDRDLLFQLFANLVDNAVKFTPQNGRITVTLAQQDGVISAAIADSGPGIADDEKMRVFDRLYRADSSRHTPGNGLGLSLVRAVADLHKASIRLEDAVPGLVVKVTFG
ncbi:MAG: HAMP domain-containing sensor histidine kinase [Alphaproteobacteria bacterium]|nr:HAMP domain-containing sensor histidine kinase [Alphaproteobacteria bacterium]